MTIATDAFDLEIIRPTESTLYSISWIEVESVQGSFTVGPNHSSLVVELKPGGELLYTTHAGKLEKIEVSSGLFSVSNGRAVVMFDV